MARRDVGPAKKARALPAPAVPRCERCARAGREATAGDGHQRELADPRLHLQLQLKKLSGGKDEEVLGETSLEGRGITTMGGRCPVGDKTPAGQDSRTAPCSSRGQRRSRDRATHVPASPTPPQTSVPSWGPSSYGGRPSRGPSAPAAAPQERRHPQRAAPKGRWFPHERPQRGSSPGKNSHQGKTAESRPHFSRVTISGRG